MNQGGGTLARAGSNGCARAAVVIVAEVAVLAGWFVWSLNGAMHPTPPDVDTFAHSVAVREADREATDVASSQIDAFRKATPWATYVGSSVTDLCHAEIRSAFVTFSSAWSPISCQRTTVVYEAFDGNIQLRLRQLDGVAQSLHWQPQSQVGQQPWGLVAALAYARQPPGGADPSQSAEAAARPADVSVRYPPLAATGVTPASTSVVAVSVGQQPTEVTASGWDDWAGTWGTSRRPYGNDDSDRTVYLTWNPVSAKALAKTGYASHGFMIAIAVSSTYNPQPTPVTASPDSPTPYYSPCYSGSGKCG